MLLLLLLLLRGRGERAGVEGDAPATALLALGL